MWQITSPYYCAGIIFEGEFCVSAAPILKWARGKSKTYLYKYFLKKGFKVYVFT